MTLQVFDYLDLVIQCFVLFSICRFSRSRSKSVSSKEKTSESKRPEITLVLPPEGADKSTSSTNNARWSIRLVFSYWQFYFIYLFSGIYSYI